MKIGITSIMAALLLLPQVGLAFQASDTTTVHINEQAVLYVIKFELGYGKYGMRAPVGAVLQRNAASSPYLEYTLMEEEEKVSSDQFGTLNGLVLSDAPVVDGQYVIPKGEARAFALVVVRTVAEGVISPDEYLQITALPFALLADERAFQNGLTAGELKTYRTP